MLEFYVLQSSVARSKIFMQFPCRYNLAQEHGDLINLHDWFQSFKTVVSHTHAKGNHRTKQCSTPKKRKDKPSLENKSDASVQYPFALLCGEIVVYAYVICKTDREWSSIMFVS